MTVEVEIRCSELSYPESSGHMPHLRQEGFRQTFVEAFRPDIIYLGSYEGTLAEFEKLCREEDPSWEVHELGMNHR